MELIKKIFQQETITGFTQGNWNAQINVPNISVNTKVNYLWYVSVSGNTILGNVDEWNVGDWAVKIENGWGKIINNISSSSGNTLIIPNLSKNYYINFLINSSIDDFGFFDTFDDPEATGVTGTTLSGGTTVITGASSSRLSELRKWSASSDLSKKYETSTGSTENGLNLSLTTSGVTYVYYIGGISYIDEYISENTAYTTTFSFESSGYSDTNNFTNLPYIKDEAKQNMIDKPIVGSDVFIIREDLPVFEDNYRLSGILNLTDLTFYGGGNYFNIVKNT